MSTYNNFTPILNAKFKKFCEARGYDENGLGFERFVNFTIFNNFQPNAFSDQELFEFICVGGDNDLGIDGLGILVNDRLVKSIQDIDDILNYSPKIKVDIVFIQSKMREDGISKDFVNNFLFGVKEFLSESIESPINENIENFFKIKNHLFTIDVCERLSDNPTVWAYFVAHTDRSPSKHVEAIVTKFIQDIALMNSYKEPKIKFIDLNSLNKLYDLNIDTFERSMKFDQLLSLNSVNDVEDSAIIFCYADEYLKILSDEDNLIRKSLFEDNVRDFQGLSNINKEIKQTIKNNPEFFALLNNGITIVCDKFSQRNKIITLTNPQIINGCQTSHIIFSEKDNADLSALPLVIKIIASTNLDIVNNIVRAANRQNIVYEEAFETTKEFHKNLEEFFLSMNINDTKIYYERRVKQYLNNKLVKPSQKFGLKIITQSFIAMFLEDVHQTHRHETILIKSFEGKIFEDNHSFYPYYTSTFAYFKLEDLIKNRKIAIGKLHSYRFHILLISKYIAYTEFMNDTIIEINSDDFCKNYLNMISVDSKSIRIFERSLEFMNEAINYWTTELKKSKFSIKDNKEFTDVLLQSLNQSLHNIQSVKSMSIMQGSVNNVILRAGKYFGFITYGNNNTIYFDSRSIIDNIKLDHNWKNKRVSFDIVKPPHTGKPYAKNVKLI